MRILVGRARARYLHVIPEMLVPIQFELFVRYTSLFALLIALAFFKHSL
jgi:hypothetical protein